MRLTTLLPVLITAVAPALVGPAAYTVCQTGCAGVVMACYSAAGFIWGATIGAIAPATILNYNAAYGCCQVTCAALLLAPTFWEEGSGIRPEDMQSWDSVDCE